MRSSNRPKILALTKSRPGISAGEIAVELGVSRQAVHRHLRALERENSVRKSGSSPTVGYYFVEEMPLSKPQIIETIKQVFEPNQDVLLVSLFGSWARERAREDSDIDIMVFLSPTAAIGRKDVWRFWDEQTAQLPWNALVSLIVLPLRSEMSIQTLLLDLPEEHAVILDRGSYFLRLKQAIVDWRLKNGAYKLESFGGRHAWVYSDKAASLDEIDFRIRIADVA